MKRETMEWLREGATWPKRLGRVPKESQRFMEVEAEMKRLRRIERAARKAVSMQTAEGLDAALGELAAVLKKGGRK